MPKRSTIIDNAIDEVVEEKLEQRMNSLVSEDTEEEAAEKEIARQEQQLELEKATATLFDSHHYVKLYRIDSLNPKHPLFLETIYDIDSIPDFEAYIQQLAYEKGWPSGKYKLAFFLKEPKTRMETRVRQQTEYNVNVPKSNLMDNANQIADNKNKETDALAAVEKSAQLIKTVRDAIGASAMQNNPNDPKMIAETFKMGVEAVRDNTPKQPQIDLSETIIKLLPVIKEIFQKPKEPSLLEQIAALKAAGIIPEQKESSLTNKIVEAALAKLLDGGGGESPSIGVEIVKQIAPQVPNMVERITGTINNALAYASNKSIQPSTVVKQETPTALPMPLFNELLAASENKDYNYFQRLAHGIGFLLDNGDMYLQAIINGDVTVDMAIDMLAQIGGENFKTDNMKNYITKFFEWYKSQFQKKETKKEEKEEEIEDKVFGECDKCHIEYGFESDEHFDEFVKLKDSICDEIIDGAICGGKVKKIEDTK